MATFKDWINQKFSAWEKAQGGRQSYYAFARFLGVSQSGLGHWMTGGAVPSGDDLLILADKLGPDVYDSLGLPRPNAEARKVTVSFSSLPPDIRQRLTSALVEIERTQQQHNLKPDSPESRQAVIAILKKWGFSYTA